MRRGPGGSTRASVASGIAARLKAARLRYIPAGREVPLSVRAWCEAMRESGWPLYPQALQGYETGRVEPPASYVAAACALTGANPRWVITGEGSERTYPHRPSEPERGPGPAWNGSSPLTFQDAQDLLAMTSAALAKELGRTVETVTSYRVGRRRVPPEVWGRMGEMLRTRAAATLASAGERFGALSAAATAADAAAGSDSRASDPRGR